MDKKNPHWTEFTFRILSAEDLLEFRSIANMNLWIVIVLSKFKVNEKVEMKIYFKNKNQ